MQRPHAWADFLQWAHQPWWRSTLWFCMPYVLPPQEQALTGGCALHHSWCSCHRAGVFVWCPSCGPHWNEQQTDGSVHWVCGWQIASCTASPKGQSQVQSYLLMSMILCASLLRSTMLKIHLISWRTFPLRAKPTSLRNVLGSIRNLVSCQPRSSTCSLLMQTFDHVMLWCQSQLYLVISV